MLTLLINLGTGPIELAKAPPGDILFSCAADEAALTPTHLPPTSLAAWLAEPA